MKRFANTRPLTTYLLQRHGRCVGAPMAGTCKVGDAGPSHHQFRSQRFRNMLPESEGYLTIRVQRCAEIRIEQCETRVCRRESEIYRTCSIQTSTRQQRRLAVINVHIMRSKREDQSMTWAIECEEQELQEGKRTSVDRSCTGGGKRTERHESQRVER